MRILIAEDEDSIGQIYKIFLNDAGHDIILTSDGEKCLRVYMESIAAGIEIDLIITDYRMPTKDGLELIKEVLSMCPDQKIIMATAFSIDLAKMDGLPGNKIKMVYKPIDLEELLIVINKIRDEQKTESLNRVV